MRQQRLVGEHVCRRAVEEETAAAQHHGAVGPFGDELHVMGDHQDGGGVALAQPRDQPHELLGAFVVLTDRRLVEDQEMRLEHQHRGDAQAPPLSEAEGERRTIRIMSEIDDSEHVLHPLLYRLLGVVAHLEAVSDFVPDTIGDELMVRVLKHVAHFGRDLLRAQRAEVLPVEKNRATRRRVDTHDETRERGFAGAIAPAERDKLAAAE